MVCPYIKQEERKRFEWVIDNLVALLEENPEAVAGNLNFVITSVLKRLIAKNRRYKTMNDLIGALECIKLELYRKVCAEYEDLKESENGSVQEAGD